MKQELKKAGRKPKLDPAVIRYSVNFNEAENAHFLALFDQTRMDSKAQFIKSCIFDKPIKVVTIDKSVSDYLMKLTQLYSQFRAIGNNYNQIVKTLKANFNEKKALAFLYQLEQATIELVKVNNEIIELTQKLEEKWLQK